MIKLKLFVFFTKNIKLFVLILLKDTMTREPPR